MHFVPVGWRAGGVGRDDEFGGAEAVIFVEGKLVRVIERVEIDRYRYGIHLP